MCTRIHTFGLGVWLEITTICKENGHVTLMHGHELPWVIFSPPPCDKRRKFRK